MLIAGRGLPGGSQLPKGGGVNLQVQAAAAEAAMVVAAAATRVSAPAAHMHKAAFTCVRDRLAQQQAAHLARLGVRHCLPELSQLCVSLQS